MSLNIVLEYEAAQRASGLVLTGEGREAEYKYAFRKLGDGRMDAEVFAGDRQGALL